MKAMTRNQTDPQPAQASQLIDRMEKWTLPPADLKRAAGQLDLFGAAS
jgi:hypothetical protein